MHIITLITSLILSFSSPSNEPSNKSSLNGLWDFVASNTLSEIDVIENNNVQWDSMLIPGNWDTHKKYSTYVGKGYYQKEFEIDESWKGKQVRIRFGAVYQTSKVWVNGQLMGKHVGGYTPFEYNITNVINFDKPNIVTVMADNTYKRGAWWAWGGISRDVSLIANEDVRLVYQHISAIPDFEKNKINFVLKYKIENNSEKPYNVKIHSSLNKKTKEKKAFKKELVVSGNKTITKVIQFQEDLKSYKLWHFDHPNLYSLTSKLKIGEEIVDVANDKFGVRKLEVKGEKLYLNNQVVRMNGLNRVHDHPDYGNTEPEHLVKSDMLDIKSLGCNFSRLMHAPLSKHILEFCDSIGFLLIEEIPVWGNDDPNSFPNNPQTKQWLKEMIERDYNHPCVVGWSVGNELRDSVPPWGKKVLTPSQLAYVNTMLDYIDELDTTRLKTYVSLSAGSIGADKTNEPFGKVDLICMNSYGNAAATVKRAHENFPGKAIFMTEIGKAQIGPAPDAKLSDELVGYMNQIKKLPYVVGVSYWCYNDYRSNYKGTPESGFREWGIVDERRNKKAAYKQLKEIYKNWNKAK